MKGVLSLLSLLLSVSMGYTQICCIPNTYRPYPVKVEATADDIRAMNHVIDSLHSRFKNSTFNQSYHSYLQAPCHYVQFSGFDPGLKQIIQSLTYNVDFDQFVSRYANFMDGGVKRGQLISLNDSTNIKPNQYWFVNPEGGHNTVSLDSTAIKGMSKHNWYYDYRESSPNSGLFTLNFYYLAGQWKQPDIPVEYRKMIDYADFMLNTGPELRYKAGYRIIWNGRKPPDTKELFKFINKKLKLKRKDTEYGFTEEQLAAIKSNLKNDDEFRNLLLTTIDRHIEDTAYNFWLGALATLFEYYDKALYFMRFGVADYMCGVPYSEIEETRQMAIMGAKVRDWNIFIRAHIEWIFGPNTWYHGKLGISVPDPGFYKELDSLNINIVDLVLGLLLRNENPINYRHTDALWKLGWIMAGSKHRDLFEERALAMMKDKQLDGFNINRIFTVYKAYLSNIEKKEAEEKLNSLKSNISSFPVFIQASVKELKDKAGE